MSEYQYYEFQTVDRPLTPDEQARIRSLSSRVQLTSSRAVFTYSYSSLRASPLELMESYFDAFLYVANWGSKQLAFRFPRAVVDYDRLVPYYFGVEEISVSRTEEHVILDFSFHEEGGYDLIEGEGMLDDLLPLRESILQGDMRALYLAWLKSAPLSDEWDDLDEADEGDSDAHESEDAGEALLEPPVPPGLKELSPSLQAFVEFFDIDADLIVAAAESSPQLTSVDDRFERWVSMLPEAERNAFLVRVARGEPQVRFQLVARLREVGGQAGGETPAPSIARRTIGELLATAERRKEHRKALERQEAERQRLRKLDALAHREPAAWAQVTALIEQKQTKPYDEAVALLVELRELAEHQGRQARFAARISAIHEKYRNRPALTDRFRRARLLR